MSGGTLAGLSASSATPLAGDPSFEVANHSWNHGDFTGFDRDWQAALVQRTNEKLSGVLETQPVVFIAPCNMAYDQPLYDITGNQSLYRLPETVLIGTLTQTTPTGSHLATSSVRSG